MLIHDTNVFGEPRVREADPHEELQIRYANLLAEKIALEQRLLAMEDLVEYLLSKQELNAKHAVLST